MSDLGRVLKAKAADLVEREFSVPGNLGDDIMDLVEKHEAACDAKVAELVAKALGDLLKDALVEASIGADGLVLVASFSTPDEMEYANLPQDLNPLIERLTDYHWEDKADALAGIDKTISALQAVRAKIAAQEAE